jgi:hypothetical protein
VWGSRCTQRYVMLFSAYSLARYLRVLCMRMALLATLLNSTLVWFGRDPGTLGKCARAS